MTSNYLTFATSEELNNFLKRKIEPVVQDKIEYCIMEKFAANKILFTAEHAMRKKIEVNDGGKGYIYIGDINTDILAKLAAFYIHSAYIFPLFLRTQADAARPPEDIGKGLRLFTRIFSKGSSKTTYMPIHQDTTYLPYLMKYHELIKHLSPDVIVSIHGMSVNRKFDVLFGFGENYEAIGGKKNAFRFKNEFESFVDGIFSLVGKKNNLKIALSTQLLTGSKNHVLTKHVIEYNRGLNGGQHKRFGMQVEFNWKGRVKTGDKGRPTIPYQILVQALGDFVYKWKRSEI